MIKTLLIIGYIAITAIGTIAIIAIEFQFGKPTLDSFNIKQIYKESTLNHFGARIKQAITIIFCWPYLIVYFLYWILHVGRKDYDR